MYNGRDGVVTDGNGLIYMRARYYSPELRRFVNADILAGRIDNAVTLNRYAYANGNPVSLIDPRGLSADSGRGGGSSYDTYINNLINGYPLTPLPTYGGNAGLKTMEDYLSKEDIAAGISVIEIDGKYYYDYTVPVMNRINEVLPDFYNHDILTFEEYIVKNQVKIFGIITVHTPSYEQYIGYVLGNLMYFYEQVNHEAPWDIKLNDPWKQQFGEIRMPFYKGGSPNNEDFVFRGEVVTREDLGNMTYGYLGSAMGIGDITLYWGGGVAAQGLEKILSKEVRDAENFYGDPKEDHIAIEKGINMYYEDYPNATPGINRTFP